MFRFKMMSTGHMSKIHPLFWCVCYLFEQHSEARDPKTPDKFFGRPPVSLFDSPPVDWFDSPQVNCFDSPPAINRMTPLNGASGTGTGSSSFAFSSSGGNLSTVPINVTPVGVASGSRGRSENADRAALVHTLPGDVEPTLSTPTSRSSKAASRLTGVLSSTAQMLFPPESNDTLPYVSRCFGFHACDSG